MADNEKIELTVEGKKRLEARLQELKDVEKPRVLEALELARNQGDLSENADYDAARDKQRQIEDEISKIQYQLDHCIIIEEEADPDTAHLGGGLITIRYLESGKEFSVHIVGSAEADPLSGYISNKSELATALLGHKKGHRVVVKGPRREYEVEIISIDPNK